MWSFAQLRTGFEGFLLTSFFCSYCLLLRSDAAGTGTSSACFSSAAVAAAVAAAAAAAAAEILLKPFAPQSLPPSLTLTVNDQRQQRQQHRLHHHRHHHYHNDSTKIIHVEPSKKLFCGLSLDKTHPQQLVGRIFAESRHACARSSTRFVVGNNFFCPCEI